MVIVNSYIVMKKKMILQRGRIVNGFLELGSSHSQNASSLSSHFENASSVRAQHQNASSVSSHSENASSH